MDCPYLTAPSLLAGDVQENVRSIDKQLMLAEQQLVTSEARTRADARDEDGLPVTEIREELDDEGNIICINPNHSSSSHSLTSVSQLLYKDGRYWASGSRGAAQSWNERPRDPTIPNLDVEFTERPR